MSNVSRIKEKILIGLLLVAALTYFVIAGVDFSLLKPILINVAIYSIPASIIAIGISLIKSDKVKMALGQAVLLLAILISPIWVRKASAGTQAVVVLVAVEFVIIGVISDRIIKRIRKPN